MLQDLYNRGIYKQGEKMQRSIYMFISLGYEDMCV